MEKFRIKEYQRFNGIKFWVIQKRILYVLWSRLRTNEGEVKEYFNKSDALKQKIQFEGFLIVKTKIVNE